MERTQVLWTRWLFRVVVTAEAALALAQAMLAGGFLSGHFDLLSMHRENATVTGVTAIVLTVCGILVWKPGGGPWWPAVVSACLFVVEAGQIVLGFSRALAIHVPLGSAILVAVVLLTMWAWRPVEGGAAR